MAFNEPVDLTRALASFSEIYSPRIVATMNDYDVILMFEPTGTSTPTRVPTSTFRSIASPMAMTSRAWISIASPQSLLSASTGGVSEPSISTPPNCLIGQVTPYSFAPTTRDTSATPTMDTNTPFSPPIRPRRWSRPKSPASGSTPSTSTTLTISNVRSTPFFSAPESPSSST